MKALSYLNSQVLSVSNWYVFQKMNIKFALAFISLIRPDQKTVSYDNLYSTLVKTHPHLSNMTIQQQQHLESDLGVNHEADLNIQMLQKLLSLYKPDLNIVTEDEKNGGKCNICGEETKNVKAHIKTHYMVKVSDAGYASNDICDALPLPIDPNKHFNILYQDPTYI